MRHLKEHPSFSRIASSLRESADCAVGPWKNQMYRCVELKWARPAYLVSGEGTRLFGSRWMRPGLERVVHAASTEAIALKESRRNYARFGIARPRLNPRVVVQIDSTLSRVVDMLRLEKSCSWLRVDELLREDWETINGRGHETLAQACGRAAWSQGMEGLIVPSALDRRGRNLVWFPSTLLPSSRLEVAGQTELERWLEK